jgi:hypothetical protein
MEASDDDGVDSTPVPYRFWVGGIAARQENLFSRSFRRFAQLFFSAAITWRSRSRAKIANHMPPTALALSAASAPAPGRKKRRAKNLPLKPLIMSADRGPQLFLNKSRSAT